jgi:quercetin dioxygenase-like cupin family protein
MNKTMKLSAALLVHASAGAQVAEELLPGQVESIEHGKGKHLYCTAGRLWVTLEHDGGDHILEPNQSLNIDENGRVVISALDKGAFKVA